MNEAMLRWSVILMFSLFVSVAFILYGLVFNDIGHPPSEGIEMVTYFVRTGLHPLFIAGLVLAFTGALIRMFLFSHIGIAETAMVSELTLVMSVILAVIIFDSSPTRKEYIGMMLIMAGVYLVQSNGI